MEWVNETWAQITSFGVSGGTLFLVAWNTFVSSRLGSKRVDKLLNFTTVAHKTFKDVKDIVSGELKVFVEDIKVNYLEPMKKQIQVEKEEKVFWQNIAISALAVAKVPVNQKQAMFEFAKKSTQISQEATKVLEQSIENDIAIGNQEVADNETIKETIKGV